MKSMIKRIIHISDIHIRTNQYHELYKKQFQSFLDEIKEISVDLENEELRIVIAGDLFHQKIVISNEQLLLLEKKCPFCGEDLTGPSITEGIIGCLNSNNKSWRSLKRQKHSSAKSPNGKLCRARAS